MKIDEPGAFVRVLKRLGACDTALLRVGECTFDTVYDHVIRTRLSYWIEWAIWLLVRLDLAVIDEEEIAQFNASRRILIDRSEHAGLLEYRVHLATYFSGPRLSAIDLDTVLSWATREQIKSELEKWA